MNSNYKRNSPHHSISRSELSTYLTTKDNSLKNAIERNASRHPLEDSALSGWNEFPTLHHSLNRLDKKFKPPSVHLAWVIGGFLLVIAAASSVWYFMSDKEQANFQEKKDRSIQDSIAVHQAVAVPKEIARLQELPKSKQILPEDIVNDFDQKTDVGDGLFIYSVDFNDFVFPEERKLEETTLVKSQPILGKEVVYHGFKLLDYRAYRSKPEIKISISVTTGTSADQGFDDFENEFIPPTKEVPYVDYIEHTMRLFSKGKIKNSLTRLEMVITTYPDDLNANFYAGLCYYNLQSYAKAVDCFKVCLDNYFQNFDEETYWYLARSYYAKGDKGIGIELFRKIAQSDGFYARQAETFLKNK